MIRKEFAKRLAKDSQEDSQRIRKDVSLDVLNALSDILTLKVVRRERLDDL